MSDHDELLQVFHEEADDLLGELEAALLALESGSTDAELPAKAFRLLHTLKGTCSMYGFNSAAGLAHEVETLFVRVRDGAITLTPELIDLALKARDAIAVLVAGSSEAEAASARQSTQVLMDAMQELAAREFSNPSHRSTGTDAADGPGDVESYSIRIRPRGDLFVRGVSLTGLVAELASLGTSRVTVDTSKVPSLQELDAEECYLSVDIELVTPVGRRAIDESLMFLDDGEYVVELLASDGAEAKGASAVAGTRDSGQNRSVRVSAERLDELVNLVGELVTTQVSLRDAVGDVESQRITDVSEELEMLVGALRESVLEMRMIPIGSTFGRFARYARDLAKELGKDVTLETEGGSSELDRSVIERIEEPLLHLIRNSIDHGIETPVERRLAGKPERSTIVLSAYHSGGSMYIRLSDDGRGIDLAAVAARAKESGAIDSTETLSDRDLIDLVFGAGFSTARELTSVSGRGVGMDVVRRADRRPSGRRRPRVARRRGADGHDPLAAHPRHHRRPARQRGRRSLRSAALGRRGVPGLHAPTRVERARARPDRRSRRGAAVRSAAGLLR